MNAFTFPEGATPLTPEEQEGLKLKHILTRSELDRWEHENIQEAFAWLARRRKTDILDERFVLQLHEKMFNKVWQWAGKFRRTDKNIGVSWSQVPVELRRLLDDTKAWIEFNAYSPDEIAYRFHHRLVWIHLFSNGNGRHSRLMTDVILTELLNQPLFTWGKEDLSSANAVRKQYIKALKAADQYEYTLLSEFVRS
ncbi:mobile mystery protein B [Siphonobacter sp. SORGH_AS_0500]|uniref:mobile mystery protein B n=1 Tax=Siphonobacter sp. SORGH_AS_0500 TaxID=1864824 RepID=UPI002865759B|nr:mobile mystery protein B [Siphonobacter sp. SORGH_AS_0500]MDR6193321.1 Fic-DOC domain mobile mystery protein B [Siphonobacter sp. SORGH_AS_0500]